MNVRKAARHVPEGMGAIPRLFPWYNADMTERRFFRLLAMALGALYLAGVTLFGALKATTPRLSSVTWLEVIYGPAITVASVAAMIAVGVWIGRRFES